jgi:hypothetical protein
MSASSTIVRDSMILSPVETGARPGCGADGRGLMVRAS